MNSAILGLILIISEISVNPLGKKLLGGGVGFLKLNFSWAEKWFSDSPTPLQMTKTEGPPTKGTEGLWRLQTRYCKCVRCRIRGFQPIFSHLEPCKITTSTYIISILCFAPLILDLFHLSGLGIGSYTHRFMDSWTWRCSSAYTSQYNTTMQLGVTMHRWSLFPHQALWRIWKPTTAENTQHNCDCL